MFFLFIVFLSIVWLLLQLMPGDITDTLIGDPNIPLATRLELAERLGLDQPLYVQYNEKHNKKNIKAVPKQ
jgi:ABC-type dipeptide/oligopeptide/nickel transport system permease component